MNLAGKRILVVEDEPIVAMCLEDMLHSFGCEVIGPAARLDEGLTLAASGPLDGAILDVNLGDARSYPIADYLGGLAVPVLFATGYGRADYPDRAGVRLIEKPYHSEQLRFELIALLS
jgi:DNA-binding NarL/FixJ family response regulator